MCHLSTEFCEIQLSSFSVILLTNKLTAICSKCLDLVHSLDTMARNRIVPELLNLYISLNFNVTLTTTFLLAPNPR